MRIHPEPSPKHALEQRPTAKVALDWAHPPLRSLYIHVPFCFHKCHYCDFYSFVDTADRQAPFVDALIRELASLASHADPDAGLSTLFIGGGTPSLLHPDLWTTLLDALDNLFNLASLRDVGEFTVECNPETVTVELMDTLALGGVNRVSVGAQSFNQRHLKTLERWHDPASVQCALALADQAGIKRRSVDLIYAIPGQTLADVREDLDITLALDPGVEHLSAYCLTYEPNTPLTVRADRGDITPIDDNLAADMQTLVHETLNAADFARYEVSNYAKHDRTTIDGRDALSTSGADARSAHNLAYWRNQSWLAAGPSASAHLLTTDPATGLPAGARWKNVPRLGSWIDAVNDTGFSTMVDYEAPDPRRTLVERLMMGIRLADGLPAADLLGQAAILNGDASLGRAADEAHATGLLETTADHWRLTDRGFLHADGVAADLMNAISIEPATKARS